jgi:hypothetical protein
MLENVITGMLITAFGAFLTFVGWLAWYIVDHARQEADDRSTIMTDIAVQKSLLESGDEKLDTHIEEMRSAASENRKEHKNLFGRMGRLETLIINGGEEPDESPG